MLSVRLVLDGPVAVTSRGPGWPHEDLDGPQSHSPLDDSPRSPSRALKYFQFPGRLQVWVKSQNLLTAEPGPQGAVCREVARPGYKGDGLPGPRYRSAESFFTLSSVFATLEARPNMPSCSQFGPLLGQLCWGPPLVCRQPSHRLSLSTQSDPERGFLLFLRPSLPLGIVSVMRQ